MALLGYYRCKNIYIKKNDVKLKNKPSYCSTAGCERVMIHNEATQKMIGSLFLTELSSRLLRAFFLKTITSSLLIRDLNHIQISINLLCDSQHCHTHYMKKFHLNLAPLALCHKGSLNCITQTVKRRKKKSHKQQVQLEL